MEVKEYNHITHHIIRSAIEVHRNLGPGLMESVYDHCLYREIQQAGFTVERQKQLSIVYKGQALDKEFYIDQLVEDEIILELKAVDAILPVHEAQLLTYLKLSGKKVGLLINFNVLSLRQGIRRKINGNLQHT
jgi:GxxExxY protein